MKKLFLFVTLSFLVSVNASEKNYLVDDITDKNICSVTNQFNMGVDYMCTDEYTIQDPDDPDVRYKWFLPPVGERDYNGPAASTKFGGIFEIKEDGTKEFVTYWTDGFYQSGGLGVDEDKSYIDQGSGEIVIYTRKGYATFNPKDNSVSQTTKNHTNERGVYFKSVKPLDDLIKEESDGSVHIGENSLVTIEENGVQQLYATDANDDMININIKKGTDLLIDGVSVAGSLNTNATNIATNTTDIATNKTSIATNTTDIATNKTSIATNTTDIATNKTSIATNTTDIATNKTSIAANTTNIAANTAEIATYTDSIAGNTTAIAALGSDLSAFKSSTNSQLNYMKSDYSSGIASAVAMSQFDLAQEGFSVGIGRGSYNDEDETAFGLGYGGEFKNGTLFKLQASKSGDASGVGLTISF